VRAQTEVDHTIDEWHMRLHGKGSVYAYHDEQSLSAFVCHRCSLSVHFGTASYPPVLPLVLSTQSVYNESMLVYHKGKYIVDILRRTSLIELNNVATRPVLSRHKYILHIGDDSRGNCSSKHESGLRVSLTFVLIVFLQDTILLIEGDLDWRPICPTSFSAGEKRVFLDWRK
jgi:hypothetical protein